MSAAAGLERGYRRLLAWYPRKFWREHEEEMLAVLMAGAREGQRRPGLAEAADVLRSALRMRLRRGSPGSGNGAWADSLAVFSVAAPLFLLAVDLLAVALPYRLPMPRPAWRAGGLHPEIGGLSLLSAHFFVITVGCEVVLAVLVLLGQRWLALLPIAAPIGYWIVASHDLGAPYSLRLLTVGVCLVEAAALIASPGPRRGRHLVNWGHGAVMLLVAGSVQAATFWSYATDHLVQSFFQTPPPSTVYLVLSIVLAVAAVAAAVITRVKGYFLLLLTAACYPFAAQLAFSGSSSSGNLLGHPTPIHLAALFAPPLLLGCAAVIIATTRSRVPPSPEHGEPGLARPVQRR